MYLCCWNKMLKFSHNLDNGHIMLNTPVLTWSLKLSNIELSQYLDGWPLGNTECCWHSYFFIFKRIFACLGKKVKESWFSRGLVGFYKSFWGFNLVALSQIITKLLLLSKVKTKSSLQVNFMTCSGSAAVIW